MKAHRGAWLRFQMRVGPADEGRRLDEVVGAWMESQLGRTLSRSSVRRVIMAGAVCLGGRPVRRPALPLTRGLVLEARVRRDGLERDRALEVSPAATLRILYEDDALLAVDKPPGLPTVPTADPRRPHLVGLVKRHLARREADPPAPGGEPYLGVHQRLDRDTSGIVLFALDRSANKGLAAAFAAHAIHKTYRALTLRPRTVRAGSWTVENRLGPAGRGQGPRRVLVHTGGQVAETEFTVLAALPGGLLVEARPRTGRKHQIRVHLAEAGLPIQGDLLYGGSDAAGPSRVMLHAARLAFVHPLSGQQVVIECPDPPDFQRALEESSRRAKGRAARAPRGRRRQSA